MLASIPARTLNPIRSRRGIPRFSLFGKCSKLPDYVFPVAGLAVGYPAALPSQSLRLPLAVTVRHNAYTEDRLAEVIDTYDRRRAAVQPYKTQRYVDEFGTAEAYGWSEDKARQYARPERSDFGAYVRKIGFKLD